MKINDGERDTRIASNVLCLERAFPVHIQDAVLFATYPNGDAFLPACRVLRWREGQSWGHRAAL